METWSYEAVLALISSMAVHYEDLNHPKKKKFVFSNLSNDLQSKKFNYNEKACYNKWRSLIRSYKTTKDKRNRTGQGASRFAFYEQMDEILGDKPSNASGHTLESFDDTSVNNEILDVSVRENIQEEFEDSASSVSTEVKSTVGNERKRKRKNTSQLSEEAKQRRHEDRMEMEKQRLLIEERKCALFKQFLDKL